MAKKTLKAKYAIGAKAKYYELTYEIETMISTETGFWYTLVNRIGYVHETELK